MAMPQSYGTLRHLCASTAPASARAGLAGWVAPGARGRAGEPAGLPVPPDAPQHFVPRRGETREVRHLTAGDETHAGARGQAIERYEPPRRGLLHHRDGGSGDVE